MLTFHFLTVIAVTVLVSVVVMRRYSSGVREGMESAGQFDLVVAPPSPLQRTTPLTVVDIDARSPTSSAAQAAERREAAARRRIVVAYLLSTGVCGLIVSTVTLWASGIEMISSRVVALTGATMGAAVPMIAVSVAWPFWRALLTWVALEFAVALLSVIVPMTIRLLSGMEFDPTLAMNAVYLLQWIAVTLTFPFALAFATGIRKLRGVAPVSLALVSVLGLVPLFGAKVADRLASGENVLFQAYGVTVAMYASFFILAPAAGWVAWRVLKSLSNAYDAKRFSDAQLIANVWWLIFVATLVAPLPLDQGGSVGVLLLAGAASFALFPILTGALLRSGTPSGAIEPRPTLLLLRLFGHTARSERFFDRVVGRWRLIGPVTAIAAPDIVARTFDPADFLRFVTGRASQAFVESQQQLEQRLSSLDVQADPDGRYRVSKFWCRRNSWQATVTALMSRSDAIVVDVRGLTADREGVRFELEQLAGRVTADRVVLVIDEKTDRAVVERSVAAGTGTLRLVRVERNSASETRRVFEALLDAADHAPEVPGMNAR